MNAIPDRGIDRDPSSRPGVPMEAPPHPLDGAATDTLPPQPPTAPVTKREELAVLTPVFGTAQPPRGLSGRLRRMAYAIPEHRARHWELLLLADRVDALEHGDAGPRVLAIALALLAAGASFGAFQTRRTKSNPLRFLRRR